MHIQEGAGTTAWPHHLPRRSGPQICISGSRVYCLSIRVAQRADDFTGSRSAEAATPPSTYISHGEGLKSRLKLATTRSTVTLTPPTLSAPHTLSAPCPLDDSHDCSRCLRVRSGASARRGCAIKACLTPTVACHRTRSNSSAEVRPPDTNRREHRRARSGRSKGEQYAMFGSVFHALAFVDGVRLRFMGTSCGQVLVAAS